MNAANVMAISPKAGAVNKVQLTRTVGKLGKASANMTSDSFDEAMGKAGEEVSGKMAKSPVEAQGSIQGKVNAKEADIKDDMPEGTEAAFLQKQQGRKPQMTKEGKTNTQEAKVNEEEPGEPGEQDAGTATASAAVLNFTTEGKASLVMDDTTEQTESVEPAAGVNLQRLLPQSGDDVQKNKNFLAMLSGQQIKPLQAQGATPNQQTNSGQEILQRIKPATMLEAQLNNHQLANQTIQPDLGLGKSMGSNLTQQSNLLTPQLGDMQQNKQAEGLTQVNRPAGVQEAVSAEAVLNKPQPMATSCTQNLRADQSNLTQQVGDMQQNKQAEGLTQQSNQSTPLEAQLSSIQQNKQAADSMLAGNWAERGLSAQDRIINPQAAALDNGKERHDAKGVALFGQSEETMPSMSAGRVNDSVTLQETGRVIVPEGNTQAQPRKENDARLVNNPLMGAGRVVEDDGQMVNPSMNMQDNSRQDLFRQNQPPVPPTIEIVTNEDGEEVSQLAEEAVGDKAPQTDSARAANEPLSMFQQSLNENLTGIKRAEAANQPQNLQNDFDVPRQIVEQARLLRRGEDTQMVIKLHPDHLGELTLKVSVSANGAVNASFHSDNAQVRAIIENTLVQLKQELNNQGLKVDNVDVYAGLTDGQLPQGEGQQAWQQNQGHNSNSSVRNLGNMEDYGEETENIAVSSPSNTDVSDGVDYRV